MTTLHLNDPPPPGGGDTQPAPLDGHSLLAQLGREVAGKLSPALDRVATLTSTGRIDRQSLRALRDEVGAARRAGIAGQHLARLVQAPAAPGSSRLNLALLVDDVLALRVQEMETRGIELRRALTPVDVVSDEALLSALLHGVLDWSFDHALGRVDLQLEQRDWPPRARLRSSFLYAPVPGDAAFAPTPTPVDLSMTSPNNAPGRADNLLDSMSWRLLEQFALALALPLRRRDMAGRTELVLDFAPAPVAEARPAPQPTIAPPAPQGPPSAVATATAARQTPLAPPADAAANPDAYADTAAGYFDADAYARQRDAAQPLAGFHVLVLAARRDVRAQVREALRDMDLLLDFVTSVEEARLFCNEDLPRAVVYEAALAGMDFQRLRDELLAQAPAMGLIQITEEGNSFDVLHLADQGIARDPNRDADVDVDVESIRDVDRDVDRGPGSGPSSGRDFASVGRDGLNESLPAALLFELFRNS